MILVNGDPMDWREGMTVQDVLSAKRYTFPLLVVTIGDTHVTKPHYATTTVPDGSDVKVIHMLSGG